MMKRAHAWWSGQSARERLLLTAAGVAGAAVLIWFGLADPALTARERAERSYDAAAALHTEMTAGAREAARLRLSAPAASAAPDEPLRAVAGALARELGLPLSRIQPGEAGALIFVFDTAAPADLFRWVDALQTRYGAPAAAVTITRNAAAQTVHASVAVVEAQ